MRVTSLASLKFCINRILKVEERKVKEGLKEEKRVRKSNLSGKEIH